MKKFLSLILCIVVLVSVFTVNVAAVDNYEPKIIDVMYDPVTEKCYIPEGYVVYVGDTLKIDRGTISFLGDFVDSKNNGEVEVGALATLSSYIIKNEWGNKLADVWGGNEIYINDKIVPDGQGWKDGWAKLSEPGKYTFYATKGRDQYWASEYKLDSIEFLTITVVDPKTVDEIVLPPDQNTDVPVDDPVDEPVVSEDPVVSDDPIVDEPIDDPIDEPIDDPVDEPIDEPVDDPAEPTDAEPAGNGWVIWVIIGAVVVVAAVVVIALVSKKKK